MNILFKKKPNKRRNYIIFATYEENCINTKWRRMNIHIFNSYKSLQKEKKNIVPIITNCTYCNAYSSLTTIILNTLNIFPVTSIIPLKLVHPKILRSALNHHSFPLFTEGNHHPWGWYNLKIQNQFLFPFFFFSSQTRSVPRTKHLVPARTLKNSRWEGEKTVGGNARNEARREKGGGSQKVEINVNRCAGIGRIKTRCGETMISADFANVVAVGQRPGLSCIAVLKSGYTTVYTLHMYQPTRPNIPSSRSSNFLHYVLLSRPSILPIIFRLINVEYVFSLFIFARSRVCDFFFLSLLIEYSWNAIFAKDWN